MAWEWPKVDEKGLARFVTSEAVNWLALPVSRSDLAQHPDGRRRIVEAIYNALVEKKVRYAPEKYYPSDAVQPIRTPAEILEAPREGTCLDLVALFCGLCLGNELLPLLIVIEGHALAAVSLTHGLREWAALDRQERELFERGPLTDPGHLHELVDGGAYLAIECTGFAQSKSLPESVPEGLGRIDGILPFDRAVAAGREQLGRPDRPFRFTLDIAVAHYGWRIESAISHPDVEKTAISSNDLTVDKVELRRRMLKAFDRERLEILCADITARLEREGSKVRVSPEIVGGRGLEAIILNLIEYLDRRGLLIFLLDAIRKTQPELI